MAKCVCTIKESVHACGRAAVPHEVVIVEAAASGRVVHTTSVWRDERVGLVRLRKQIWNHKTLLDKNPCQAWPSRGCGCVSVR